MKAVFYNRTDSMQQDTIGHRRFRLTMRPLVVILLCGCATMASSSFGVGQGSSSQGDTFARATRRAVAYGRVGEAESLAKARPGADSEAAAVLARLAIRRGDYDGARKLLEPVASEDPTGEAALELGLLLHRLGRRDEAAPLLAGVFRRGSGGADAEALFRAARAAQAMDRPRDAHEIYRAAASMAPDPGIETAWGALLYDKHQFGEALQSFKKALEIDPRWAPAHAGVALTLAQENPSAAAEAAHRALEIDNDLAEAHLFLAGLELDNTRYPEAREHIDRVLATNRSHLDAKALVAAIAYVRDDRAAFEAEVKEVLAIAPGFGEVYRVAGDLAARNYRFDEAVALTRQATTLDPTNTRAFAELGMHLMRTGDEAEARRVLDRAWKSDPFDAITHNLLGVLDTLEKFEVIEEGDLVVKLDPEEAPVLREYAVPLARESLKVLSEKYQFTPKGPILVEIFPQHDHFAVRNMGLQGLIGALGACFGRVVSMDSPRARAPGSFSWQATLWHELAHVVTLQMSKQRVPRWLTEGVSVYEEARARPAWGREMEVPFALALERGQVLKLSDLNSGFTKPETIALAYYQASLLVEHIVRTHGDAALRTLLVSYGDGLEGEEALKRALGVSFDQLQGTFDKMLAGRFGSIRAALRDQAKGPPDMGINDVSILRAAAAANPGSFQAQLAYGMALAGQGDRAAFEPLEKAASLVPMAIGDNSPHAVMGRLADQLGDAPRAIKEYQALLAHDHTGLEPARRLAALASKAQDEKALALAYDRIVELDPFDAEGHTGLGRLAIQRKDPGTAVREFRAALAIGPADRASAHCDLGEGYLLAGQRAEAKREVLAALEIAPSFERAQDLLLKIVDGGSTPGLQESGR
jgi:cellulose synthase operon protein C